MPTSAGRASRHGTVLRAASRLLATCPVVGGPRLLVPGVHGVLVPESVKTPPLTLDAWFLKTARDHGLPSDLKRPDTDGLVHRTQQGVGERADELVLRDFPVAVGVELFPEVLGALVEVRRQLQ